MQRRAGYTLDNRKVAIIDASFVEASIAYAMALRDIAIEIVIEVMDIRHGIPSMGTTGVYCIGVALLVPFVIRIKRCATEDL